MAMLGRGETLFLRYRTTNTAVEWQPDRRIAWQPFGLGGPVGGQFRRYELTPTDGGTLVARNVGRVSGQAEADDHRRSMPQQTEFGSSKLSLGRCSGRLPT
jgi:hypothetical protein